MTFVANTTGQITALAITVTAAANTKGYDGTTTAAATPTITAGSLRRRRHGGLHRDLRHQERGHGQDAHGGRLGQRRQRRQQLRRDLRRQHRPASINAAGRSRRLVTSSASMVYGTPMTFTAIVSARRRLTTARAAWTSTTRPPSARPSTPGTCGHRGKLTWTLTAARPQGHRRQQRQQLRGDRFAASTARPRYGHRRADHGHRGRQHQDLRRHDLGRGHADDHLRQPGRGDTAAFSETYDTRNVGTGMTLTPAGSVNDGNGGSNYTVTLRANTAGSITARAITVTAAANTKSYDGTTTAAATPTITGGSLAGTRHGWPSARAYDTRNAGTGKTLTAAGSVNDGNGGNNYTVTFDRQHRRARSRRGRSRSPRRPTQGLRRHDHGGGHADGHRREPGGTATRRPSARLTTPRTRAPARRSRRPGRSATATAATTTR